MNIDLHKIKGFFKGTFIAEPDVLRQKLFGIKAYIYDWDGVFNNGVKDENGSSPFSEVDAMGTNMLRFNHYLRTGEIPVNAIISGEENKASFALANREHFHSVYYRTLNKKDAFNHLCKRFDIKPHQVAFIFDDILDFSVASLCGLRIMVARQCNPLLLDLAKRNKLVDYITFADGANHAIRESSELLTGISDHYDETILQRMIFSEKYRQYLQLRNTLSPAFYTVADSKITEQLPQ